MRGGTFTQTFNGEVEWQFDGGYFKLIATVNPVDIELWYQGRQSFTADQVSAGFYQREQFDKIKITTGALEAVTFLFAPDEGGTAGDVVIVTLPSPLNLAIADNADGQAAVGAAGILPVLARGEAWNGASFDRLRADNIGGAGALRVTERGITYGATWGDTTPHAVNTARTVIAAAINVNGVIIWGFDMNTGNTTAAPTAALIAKATPPTTVIDGEVLCSPIGTALGASNCAYLRIDRPMFIAAGKGIFTITGQAESIADRSMRYTIL